MVHHLVFSMKLETYTSGIGSTDGLISTLRPFGKEHAQLICHEYFMIDILAFLPDVGMSLV